MLILYDAENVDSVVQQLVFSCQCTNRALGNLCRVPEHVADI